ncbi:hypothetical protein [Caldivirga sp. UBA161]|uniref:hypothetical protein n=1 Tax=Caldivirga sp. UBA161 TaxID=1915569 RepID=UPI0025B916AC|nr:hypothetical protein [Caldivirga sp. UBA161]
MRIKETALVTILDLGIGVTLSTYSVNLIGLGLTVIVTGCMPLIAQVMAKLMVSERATLAKLTGANSTGNSHGIPIGLNAIITGYHL